MSWWKMNSRELTNVQPGKNNSNIFKTKSFKTRSDAQSNFNCNLTLNHFSFF